MKDNGCACAVLSIPLLIVIWIILNPLWALFFGVTISSVAGSKTDFEIGDEISWSIDSSDEDLSPQLREYADRSGGSVDFEGTIVGMTDFYYRLHVTDEVSFRKLSGGGYKRGQLLLVGAKGRSSHHSTMASIRRGRG